MKLYLAIEKLFDELEKLFCKKQFEEFCQCEFSELTVYHLGLGTWIRNHLLQPGEPLFQMFLECGIHDRDDMSTLIIQLFYLFEQEQNQGEKTEK